MSQRIRIAIAAALAAGAVLIATANPASAFPQPEGSSVSIYVTAPDPEAVLADLTPQFYPVGPGDPIEPCIAGTLYMNSQFDASQDFGCDVPAPGSYQIGVDGLPDNAEVSADCYPGEGRGERIDGEMTEFTLAEFDIVNCYIDVVVPAVFIDKTVASGTASTDASELEVYSDPGDLGNLPAGDGGVLVATATDPSAINCYAGDLADCAVVPLLAGDYQLGEVPTAGYLATNVYCVPVFDLRQLERFPNTAGTFTLGGLPDRYDEGPRPASPFVYCEVTNDEFAGDILVEKVLVNDDGGTAKVEDFTAEVFTEPGGALAASATCAADGSCIDEALPIGQYRVGESGPDGYTASVVCDVSREPDNPVLGTTPSTLPPWGNDREALPGDSALFELEPFGQVTCVITNNDDPVPTTTTTTIAPTTTDAAQVPPAPQLPATGSDASSQWMIVAFGAAMLLMGSALMAARRRT